MPTADPKPSVREEQHINDLEYRGLPDGTIPGEGAAVQELAQIALRLLRERDEARREIEGLRRLKQSMDEALNSGDGVYRP